MAFSLVVLPLGDSITDGVPTQDGYRRELAASLATAGITVTYVGSLASPAGRHEGWSGFRADELIPKLRALLGQVRPQVVLLHIGTNDLGLGVPIDETVGNVRKLLELIHDRSLRDGARAPAIQVFLAQIIRRNLFAGGEDEPVRRYNSRLATLAAARRAAGQPVHLVDMSKALDPRTDLEDALHPNRAGYRKMAAAWAAAVRNATSPPRPTKK